MSWSNTFGKRFTITTWGESHGPAVGVIIDGMPSNVAISVEEINVALKKRAPGFSQYTSTRKEDDAVEILSGIFNGKTTGAPISLLIKNNDVDSSTYEAIKNRFRPGHADLTYTKKYINYDYRGGGRASARETVCRVAAGVFAKKILEKHSIKVQAYLQQVGNIAINYPYNDLSRVDEDEIFCPDQKQSKKMQQLISSVKKEGDSIGGVVGFCCKNVPIGLGQPIYHKLEAQLAGAMLSIPASKGFEIGQGFLSAEFRGKKHNDELSSNEGKVVHITNNSGGTLGGISTGEIIYGRVAFKPTSSITKEQKTVNKKGEQTTICLPLNSRHDPCVAVRAVSVVKAMCCLVLADLLVY